MATEKEPKNETPEITDKIIEDAVVSDPSADADDVANKASIEQSTQSENSEQTLTDDLREDAGSQLVAPIEHDAKPLDPLADAEEKVETLSEAAEEEYTSAQLDNTETSKENSDEPMKSAVQQEPALSGAGFWPALVGGVIAAGLGFAAGRMDQLDAYLPQALQRQPVDLSAIDTRFEAIEAQVASVAAGLGSPDDSLQAQLGVLADRLAGLENVEPNPQPDLSQALASQLSDLEDKIAELEARPLPRNDAQTTEITDGLSGEMEALRETLLSQEKIISTLADKAAQAEAEAEAAEALAQSEALKTLARASLMRIVTAMDTGAPFDDALRDLKETGASDIPQVLEVSAQSGVATAKDLQDGFPDAARAALSAVRAQEPAIGPDGVVGFLRRQLGARSIIPREGSDPDAVLSRAEAAVREGRLTDALSEIDALPDLAKSEMATWTETAQHRNAAENAARELMQSLTPN